MSADRLREAAKVLREKADACDPWQGDDDHGSWADEYRTDGGNGTDAAFIRTMHPGVGLALADLLDEEAGFCEYQAECWGKDDSRAHPPLSLLAVADAILGGAS